MFGEVVAMVALLPSTTGLCRAPPECQALPLLCRSEPDKYTTAPAHLDNAVLSMSQGHCEFALSQGSNCLLVVASLELRDTAVTLSAHAPLRRLALHQMILSSRRTGCVPGLGSG